MSSSGRVRTQDDEHELHELPALEPDDDGKATDFGDTLPPLLDDDGGTDDSEATDLDIGLRIDALDDGGDSNEADDLDIGEPIQSASEPPTTQDGDDDEGLWTTTRPRLLSHWGTSGLAKMSTGPTSQWTISSARTFPR